MISIEFKAFHDLTIWCLQRVTCTLALWPFRRVPSTFFAFFVYILASLLTHYFCMFIDFLLVNKLESAGLGPQTF